MTPKTTARATDDELQKSTFRAVSHRLLNFLFVLYVVAFLDRVNVGFAALEMNRDLGLTPSVYGLGAGLFFVGYCLFEVPSNLILTAIGARVWIARIMITWGIISTGMMFVTGPISFCALRFFLGLAEAGFFPGVIFYLVAWLPAELRARAVAHFMVAIPVSGIIGGPLSGALLGLNGRFGLSGWQWLFLLEGAPAILLGFAVMRYLPDRPEDARWLGSEQRHWLSQRLRDERAAESCQAHSSSAVAALSNSKVWKMGLFAFLSISFGQYAIAFWMPQILRSLSGFDNLEIGILAAIPNIVAAAAMLAVAAHSDRSRERCLYMAGTAFAASLGFLGCALAQSPTWSIMCLCVANAGVVSAHGPFWPLPSSFLSGKGAAAGIALISCMRQTNRIIEVKCMAV